MSPFLSASDSVFLLASGKLHGLAIQIYTCLGGSHPLAVDPHSQPPIGPSVSLRSVMHNLS